MRTYTQFILRKRLIKLISTITFIFSSILVYGSVPINNHNSNFNILYTFMDVGQPCTDEIQVFGPLTAEQAGYIVTETTSLVQNINLPSRSIIIDMWAKSTGQSTVFDNSDNEVEFCEYNIDLIVGDTFNIRDYVHLKDGGVVDFNNILFTYTLAGANDPTIPPDWNLDAFNNGLDVTATAEDAKAEGNHGQGRFRIYVVRNGESEFDDSATGKIIDFRPRHLIRYSSCVADLRVVSREY